MISALAIAAMLAAAPFSSSQPWSPPVWVDAGPLVSPNGYAIAPPGWNGLDGGGNIVITGQTFFVTGALNQFDAGPTLAYVVWAARDPGTGNCAEWQLGVDSTNPSPNEKPIFWLNTANCDGTAAQALEYFYTDGRIVISGPQHSASGYVTDNGEDQVVYPSKFQGMTSDAATREVTVSANVSGDATDTYGHNGGVQARNDDGAYTRVAAVGYSNSNVHEYGYTSQNLSRAAGSMHWLLDATSYDGFADTLCADPGSTNCTEGVDTVYCPAGTNPRDGSCVTIRHLDKAGDLTLAGALTFGTFSGTTPPVTCGATFRGATATELGNGTSTNDKECRCVNAAGTYKWTSRDLVTGTITATGNTTTCN